VSFAFEVDKQQRVTTIVVTGPIDLRASVRALGDLVAHPDFAIDQRFVVDLRGMTEFPASLGEMRVLAWTLQQEGARFRGKVALVLPQDSYAPRAGRVERLNSLGNFGLAAFPDIDEAVEWVRAA
jgi:hypothetical protein